VDKNNYIAILITKFKDSDVDGDARILFQNLIIKKLSIDIIVVF
jgi:hypothetical protein